MKRKKVKRKNKNTGLGLIIVIVFLICGMVMIKKQSLNHEQVIANSRLEELKEDLEEEKDVSKDLEEKEAYMQTRKFVEDVARDKFGLVYEDEYVFKSEEE